MNIYPLYIFFGQVSLCWHMKLVEDQDTLKVAIFLLELWAHLGSAQCSQDHLSWRYISSEVVIPRKQMFRGKSFQVPGWVSYSLKFGGQRHVIHMQLKKLLRPRYLPVISQDDQGALHTDHPHVPRDCYYIGYLEKIPYSLVTADMCYGGIEGIMKLDDLTYEIKPLKDSHRFEHIISQIVANGNAMEPAYKPGTQEEIDSLFSAENITVAPKLSSTRFASHELSIQGLPQCSHAMYRTMNNFTECVKYMVGYTNVVDSFLWGLHVRYYIIALIIYNVRDPATLTPYEVPGSPFYTFYQQTIYQNIQHKSSFMVDKDGPEDYAFSTKFSRVCHRDNLVMIGQLGRPYILLSTITAQNIGLSLGVPLDGEFCVCQRRATCIMQIYPGITDAFSNCSFNHTVTIHLYGPNCLAEDRYPLFNETLTEFRCGNEIVEETEQCDCGSFKKCYSNPCCTTNCELTPGSHCDIELCCTNCTYTPTGTLCRPIQNICDLPEYCNGNTHTCPVDFHMQDGTPCSEKSYCFKGNCTDRDLQCKAIFGNVAMDAPDVCYTLNTEGDRFGQCTRKKDVRYKTPCPEEHKFCGRLQCTNVTHLPQLQEHVSFHQSLLENAFCFGVDEHRRTGSNDVGRPNDGSICAPGKYCNFVFCNGSVANIGYDCFPEKCNYRGICNNLKNCHCHVGWDPPLCLKRGAGGSINSGPPPRKMRSVKQKTDIVIYLRVVYGRIYAFLFALLFGLATNVRNIKTTTIIEEGTES
ncbi:disintegrin and metalloproteinase domain-containing protein 21-like [Dasypus novemcinctus]|uniref:disintegrin and metalloproteinase domain-containing protein 21-like n=1 Tax=Dasypus novemcinctus TaxID=9361 RepID=UPI0026604DD9|nr:disintegrin and metalloproteinase domain-containing protein 21-like [Dasypus novemcinctus]XP_058157114.1 disintegrin and metalloproteinase domain-containing protein 21-like [Dasypus novemcinctus]